ncbi:MAG: MFS transporter [Chloroflexi bacterium]|nr:MFS transporter [Chloroflexota bacterium]
MAIAGFTETAEFFPVLSVLLKPMTEEFGWSRTEFTLATSAGTLAGGIAGPLVGAYVDRIGARMILLVGFSILGATMLAMAFITELWQFSVLQIIGRFIALGVISLALSIMIPKWFVTKRARAVAISGMGGRLGQSLSPIYVQLLVTAYSWRVATVVAGLLVLVVTLLPVGLFVRRQPEDIGLLPDGVTPEQRARQEAAAQAAGKPIRQDISFTLRQVARMPAFYLLLCAQIAGTLVGPALNLHMVPYFTDKGMSTAVALATLTALFLSGALGSLAFGFLAEWFGIKAVVTVDYVLMGLGFGFLLLVDSAEMAILWGVFMGIMQGGGGTLNQVLFADYFGRGSIGSIRGAITPVQLAANAVGPLAASLAFDHYGNYVAVFLAFGILRLVSGGFILLAKPPAGSAADLMARGRTLQSGQSADQPEGSDPQVQRAKHPDAE